jgi:predicted  nucleic acid-binding Zn-ribbon protein
LTKIIDTINYTKKAQKQPTALNANNFLEDAKEFDDEVKLLEISLEDLLNKISAKEKSIGFNSSTAEYINMIAEIDRYKDNANNLIDLFKNSINNINDEIAKLTPSSGTIIKSNQNKIDILDQAKTIYVNYLSSLIAIVDAIDKFKLKISSPSPSSASAASLGLSNNAIKDKDNFLSKIGINYKKIETDLGNILDEIAAVNANKSTNNSARNLAKNRINKKKQGLIETLNDMNKAINIEMVPVEEEITRLNNLMQTNNIKDKIARLQAIIATAKDYQTKIQTLITTHNP